MTRPLPLQPEIARRLRVVMAVAGVNRRELAEQVGVSDSVVGNWLGNHAKANKPNEEAMVRLCELHRGLTMDYLYRGILDAVPMALALSLQAEEARLRGEE